MENKLIELVKDSPRLVKAHDKKNWLNLFSKDAVIADPVGTRPVPYSNLSHFYETFIAPNDIVFEEKLDVVAENQMARDVLILTKLPGGLRVDVPAHLFYKVEKKGDLFKIISMNAHWDLTGMVFQFLTKKGALKEMVGLSVRLMKNLGLLGGLGFFKGMVWGIKGCGKKAINKVFNKQNINSFSSQAKVEFPVEKKSLSIEEFFQKDLNYKIERVTSAGWFTTFTFKKDGKSGIGRFEFSPLSRKIIKAQIFLN